MARLSLSSVHLSNIEESLPRSARFRRINLASAAMNRSSSPTSSSREDAPNAFSTGSPRRIFLTPSRSALFLDREDSNEGCGEPQPPRRALGAPRAVSSSLKLACRGPVVTEPSHLAAPALGPSPRDDFQIWLA